MDDCFKDWIEEVAKETGLDRNQIISLLIACSHYHLTIDCLE
ncbi:hypothetical protein [Salipaludibacillus sp. LMS25]|jgi:hypothetical protein|nr:hypothetical protein [Salipaludibacillus sp. LMS25]